MNAEQCRGMGYDEDESSSSHQGQVAMLISQFEVGGSESGDRTEDSTEVDIPPDSPRLEIPLHIRRREHHSSGAYSPVRVEHSLSLPHDNGLGNSTTLVRHFFENIVSKGLPEIGMPRTYSTEMEDSGFQV